MQIVIRSRNLVQLPKKGELAQKPWLSDDLEPIREQVWKQPEFQITSRCVGLKDVYVWGKRTHYVNV